jgi:hypothetical protein
MTAFYQLGIIAIGRAGLDPNGTPVQFFYRRKPLTLPTARSPSTTTAAASWTTCYAARHGTI